MGIASITAPAGHLIIERLPAPKRKRNDDRASILAIAKQRLEPAHPTALGQMPLAAVNCVMTFLGTDGERVWNQLNRWSRQHLGNSPFYADILRLSKLEKGPHVTCAASMYDAVKNDHKRCMMVAAEAFMHGDPSPLKFNYVCTLLKEAVSNPNYPKINLYRAKRLERLWKLHGLGHNTGEADGVLYHHQFSKLLTEAKSPQKSIHFHLQLLTRALFGFCDRTAAVSVRVAMKDLKVNTAATEEQRRMAEIGLDIFDDLLATNIEEKISGYLKWREHLDDPLLKKMGINALLELFDIQHLYLQPSHVVNNDRLEKRLITLIRDESNSAHIRALATCQLANQALARRSKCLSDQEIGNVMVDLMGRTFLRDAVRRQMQIIYHLFHVAKRLNRVSDFEVAHFAYKRVYSGVEANATERGLAVSGTRWAEDVLMRLHVEGRASVLSPQIGYHMATALMRHSDCTINDKFRYTHALAYFRFLSETDLESDIPGSYVKDSDAIQMLIQLRTLPTPPMLALQTCLLIAKFHMAGRSNPQLTTDQAVMDLVFKVCQRSKGKPAIFNEAAFIFVRLYLKQPSNRIGYGPTLEIIRQIQTVANSTATSSVQRQEAAYLLARWFIKYPQTIAKADAMAYCKLICESESVPDVKLMAFNLFRQIEQMPP